MTDNEVKVYSWWGNKNEPPENLKTKKQLAELGLKPVKPDGVIHTQKYDLYLYDINNSQSVRPKRKATEKQLEALAKGREAVQKNHFLNDWYKYTGKHIKNQNDSIRWAKDIIKNKSEYLLLDTETTSIDCPEIIQIALIDLDGNTIFNSLVKPLKFFIEPEAIAIHNITNEMVDDAPYFKDIYPQLKELITNKQILIYNADFDNYAIRYSCEVSKLEKIKYKSECLMQEYAVFNGDYSEYHENYRWVRLEGDHSALGDCLKALELLKDMAETELIDYHQSFENSWLKYKNL